MRFSFSWLKDHIQTDISVEKLVEALNNLGLEVEHVGNRANDLLPLLIAKVVSTQKHPTSRHLLVCSVDAGLEDCIQIVCKCPNARAGLNTVFAPLGTIIPSTGITVNESMIYGVKSYGMLCSNAELQLEYNQEAHRKTPNNIVELPSDAPVGTRYALWAGLEDPVFKICITPNRGDCASVRGIARDLAAKGFGTLKKSPTITIKTPEIPSPIKVTIEPTMEAQNSCQMISGRCMTGVTNRETPRWIQKRLVEAGLRPISLFVDIANYIVIDLGQPLHIYDMNKLNGNLRVRHAKPGEEILALDGINYALNGHCLVVADNDGPVSIAGVLGGKRAACEESTNSIFIESANFNSTNISKGRESLNISSEASYRFERGIDHEATEPILNYATKMIIDICGGTPYPMTLAVGQALHACSGINFQLPEIERISGLVITRDQVVDILSRLNFGINDIDERTLRLVPPSWRKDITDSASLIGELLRMHDLGSIVPQPLQNLEKSTSINSRSVQQKNLRFSIGRILAARGMLEAITWSFISENHAKTFGGGQKDLTLANPISTDLSYMRPSLLPGLLNAAELNNRRGTTNLSTFEVGHVFWGRNYENQKLIAAGIRCGTGVPRCGGRDWRTPAKPVIFAEAKADVLAVLEVLKLNLDELACTREAPPWYHVGRSAIIHSKDGSLLASFGELDQSVLALFDVSDPVVVFEINLSLALELLQTTVPRGRSEFNSSKLPSVSRDYAFILDEDVDAERILKAVSKVDETLISQVSIFDIFRDQSIGDDKKSVAVNVVFTPKEVQFTDADLETISSKLIETVKKATGGTLRQPTRDTD